MNELIEKLKKNKVVFGLLEPIEQTFLRGIGAENCLVYAAGPEIWDTATEDDFCRGLTYAIKPDYQSEPEYVDVEIEVKGRRLIATDYSGILTGPTAIHMLPSLPNFEGFWKNNIHEHIYLDLVAMNVSKGRKVYARFRT
jgi:hypothetical protein